MRLTDDELKAIEARRKLASKGQWESDATGIYVKWGSKIAHIAETKIPRYHEDRGKGMEEKCNNTDFIVNAPSDIDTLLAEVRALQAENRALEAEAGAYRDCLQYYAQKLNYKRQPVPGTGDVLPPPINDDLGERARKALSSTTAGADLLAENQRLREENERLISDETDMIKALNKEFEAANVARETVIKLVRTLNYQPVTTAPKDGRVILMNFLNDCDESPENHFCYVEPVKWIDETDLMTGQTLKGFALLKDYSIPQDKPTGWLPMPEPEALQHPGEVQG